MKRAKPRLLTRAEQKALEDAGLKKARKKAGPQILAKGLPTTCVPELPPAPTLEQLRKETIEAATIGVPEIDAEHHLLIAQYYALLEALSRGCDAHTFALRYHLFIHRVRRHFAHEERMMLDIGFDDYDHHKVLHTKLLRDAERFLAKLVRGSEKIESIAVTRYLEHWLLNHIATHDRKIGEFLSRRVWPS